MKDIHQLKADKTKEKGSQHDPDHAADREETLARGVPRNAEQRFITMVEVVTLLEQEKPEHQRRGFSHEDLLTLLKYSTNHIPRGMSQGPLHNTMAGREAQLST